MERSFSVEMAKLWGPQVAIMVSALLDEYNYQAAKGMLEDGYFCATVAAMEKVTTLSKDRQKKILDKLQAMGIVDDVKRKGVPAKRYIRFTAYKFDPANKGEG